MSGFPINLSWKMANKTLPTREFYEAYWFVILEQFCIIFLPTHVTLTNFYSHEIYFLFLKELITGYDLICDEYTALLYDVMMNIYIRSVRQKPRATSSLALPPARRPSGDA